MPCLTLGSTCPGKRKHGTRHLSFEDHNWHQDYWRCYISRPDFPVPILIGFLYITNGR